MLQLFETPAIVRALGLYLFVFGLVTIAGGIFGFVKAKSRASLIAGSVSGMVLCISGRLVAQESRAAVFLGLLVSVALGARFGSAFKKQRKVMPAGIILLFAMGSVALSATVLFTWRG